MFRPSLTAALCSLVFLTACETVDGRLRQAAEETGRQEAQKALPDYPADCRRQERSGVRQGESLDTALIRTDQALGQANARVHRCAGWYDTIQSGFSGDDNG